MRSTRTFSLYFEKLIHSCPLSFALTCRLSSLESPFHSSFNSQYRYSSELMMIPCLAKSQVSQFFFFSPVIFFCPLSCAVWSDHETAWNYDTLCSVWNMAEYIIKMRIVGGLQDLHVLTLWNLCFSSYFVRQYYAQVLKLTALPFLYMQQCHHHGVHLPCKL